MWLWIWKKSAYIFPWKRWSASATAKSSCGLASAPPPQCDDIVDEGLQMEEAALRLAAHRESLDRCLAGQPQGPMFTALKDAVDTFGIFHEHLYGLIEGVE